MPPVRAVSVPKLELTALLLAARLTEYVINSYKEELKVEKIMIWSDSQVVLTWLKYERSFNIYVRNCIDEIFNLVPSGITEFRYVNTKDNPSDLLTRGVTVRKLCQTTHW